MSRLFDTYLSDAYDTVSLRKQKKFWEYSIPHCLATVGNAARAAGGSISYQNTGTRARFVR